MPIDVTLFDDLDALAPDAAGALDRAAQPSLHDRIDWFRQMREHDLGDPPLIARARDERGSTWLPLTTQGAAFGCWYTLAYRAIDPDPARLAAIAKALRGRLARIDLQPVREEDGHPIAAAFAATGWRVRRTATSVNRRSPVPAAGFDAWWSQRPKRLRETVRRKTQALDVELLDHFDAEAWEAYDEIYAASWKPAEGSPAFLRDLAQRESAAGTLRMGIARHDGRPVAAQWWLVENGTATIHKLAHRSDADTLSPGTILTAAMARFVIDRDAPAMLDFGTGDDPYKADWMEEAHPLETLTMVDPRTATGLIDAAATLVRGLLRR